MRFGVEGLGRRVGASGSGFEVVEPRVCKPLARRALMPVPIY